MGRVWRSARGSSGTEFPGRITYADWAWSLASYAAAEGFTLYFLGARPGIAEKAAEKLKRRYPDLKVSGIHHGYFDHSAESEQNEALIKEINTAAPDILLVGFGMPLQGAVAHGELGSNRSKRGPHRRRGVRLCLRRTSSWATHPDRQRLRVAGTAICGASTALAPLRFGQPPCFYLG